MTTAQQQRALGAYGERIAARHLEAVGMTVLDRNWRCRYGELDLVLRDGSDLVVAEVKSRRGNAYGHPLTAVSVHKLQRIRGLALLWAVARAPWVELFSDLRRQHLLFGTMLALFLLWLVRRDFDSGLSYHFIGMTAVTLLLDWPLAVLGGLAAQLGLVALGKQDLAALGINGD